jgi:hypothetical protein
MLNIKRKVIFSIEYFNVIDKVIYIARLKKIKTKYSAIYLKIIFNCRRNK